MDHDYSLSDIRAATGEGGFGGGNNWWILILFFLFGGYGDFGNRGEAKATTADVQRGFDNQAVISKLDGLSNGLCDGFYAANTGMLNGFHGVDTALCTGFNSVNQSINQSRFDAQQCCCETNRNIDAVRFENSKNTCDITNAIHAEGEQTRALINANTMQNLRDKLADKDRDLQSAQFQLSQLSQNAYLVNQLKPCPIPAYQVPNPCAPCGGCCA